MSRSFYSFIFAAILLSATAAAKTIIINPLTDGGFELGPTFADNGWMLVNNASGVGNNWRFTTSTLTNGSNTFAPTGTQAAFISQNATGSYWGYNISTYSTTHFYKNVTFPAGKEIIDLHFRWNAQGEGTATASYDVLYVYLCPTTLNPVINSPYNTSSVPTAWTGTGSAVLLGAFHSSSNPAGSVAHISIPATYAGTTQRIVFTWKNGNILGNQPPAAIDSISLVADCPKPVLYMNNTAMPCAGNVVMNTTVEHPSTTGTFQWMVNGTTIAGHTASSYTSSSVVTGDIITCIYNANNACAYADTATYSVIKASHDSLIEYMTICSDKLPTTWRSITIPAGASSNPTYHTIVKTKADGCDSVITLNLTVNSAPPAKTEYISTCRNLLNGMTWRGKSIPVNAVSSSRFDSVYVPSPTGCDSLIYLNLQIIDSATSYEQAFRGCTQVIHNGVTYKHDTVVIDTIRNMADCDSIYYVNHIKVDNFQISVTYDTSRLYVHNDWVTFDVHASMSPYEIVSWTPTALFPNQTASTQTVPAPLNETIRVIAKNDIGCLDTAYAKIESIEIDNRYAIPNAFSPNCDGLNDVFRLKFIMERSNHNMSMEIFDRWGARIFYNHGRAETLAWDGTYKGESCTAGTYFYRITLIFSDGTTEELKGDVTLVR